MTTTQAPTTPTTASPAPAPASPAAPALVPAVPPASQQSVRALWAAVILLGVCCALYVTHEHPALAASVGAVGGLLGGVAGAAAWLRR